MTTSYLMVVPYAYKPYLKEFEETSNLALWRTATIDNTVDNIGVAASWNVGIDMMRLHDYQWLIIASAAIRFGEPGGRDMLEQIEKHQDKRIITFAKKDVPEQDYIGGAGPSYYDGVFYWHLTAVRADVFDEVGKFDENFYPVYFEDTDFDLRIFKAYGHEGRIIVPVDAQGTTVGHGVELGGIKAPAEPNIEYFKKKWGKDPNDGEARPYGHPFNHPGNSIKFWPTPPDRSVS